MSKKNKIYIITVIVFVLFSWIDAVSAIGQLTKPIVIENALRGQEIEQTMTLINSEEKEVIFALISENDVAGWATFFEKDNLTDEINETTLAPKERKVVKVVFTIPEDVANGEYAGFISIISNPVLSSTTSQVSSSLKQKIARRVTISVSDQEVIDLEADIIPIDYGVVLGEPIKLKIAYTNNGNIAVEPQVEVLARQVDKIFSELTFNYPSKKDAVKPMQTVYVDNIQVPSTGVELGKLRLELAIVLNNDIIKEETVMIDILPKKVLETPAIDSTEETATKYIEFYFYGGIFLFAVILAFFVARKKISN